jgi:ABC-2 type transport system ATP-binding protein
MIQVKDLRKLYGDLVAVDGISFEVAPGEIYGLLGPNGAGKTTTISTLCGLLRPDSGRVVIDGKNMFDDPRTVKRILGVVPQEPAIYEELSARENLKFWGGLYGLTGRDLSRKIERALERVGLGGRAKEPSKRFSGGMKRRLNLAIGLVHEPKVLLLDEPTVGIDPQARINILDVVREAADAGTTVLYTTHYLEEAEQLCRRIGIVDKGRLLAEGTLDELQQIVGQGVLVSLRGDFPGTELSAMAAALLGVTVVSVADGEAVLSVEEAEHTVPDLLSRLLGQQWDLADISLKKPSLEDVFIRLTGRELRD